MNFKRKMISKKDIVPIAQQCDIAGISRSGIYYKPSPEYSKEELQIILEIDRIYIKYPFFGHRRIHEELIDQKYKIGKERVLKYMRIMGIKPIYPKPKTTIHSKEHKMIYPYLLDEIKINRANKVWSADITYIPIRHGFCYLVAIIDWYSRKILSWRLSNSMGRSFCLEALQDAFDRHGSPEIFNTDQGSQFTSNEFTSRLQDKNIKISMDSKGRALDDIIIERFWRSLKYEDIYIYNYSSIKTAKDGINKYIAFYNNKRKHSSLKKNTPDWVFNQSFRVAA